MKPHHSPHGFLTAACVSLLHPLCLSHHFPSSACHVWTDRIRRFWPKLTLWSGAFSTLLPLQQQVLFLRTASVLHAGDEADDEADDEAGDEADGDDGDEADGDDGGVQ